METKAFYAGFFDPIHRGHLSIAEQAAKKYGKCIIAIGDNKNKTPLFNKAERTRIAKEALEYCKKCYFKEELDIEVISYDGYAVDAAIEHGCTHLVRGARDAKDCNREDIIRDINHRLLQIRFEYNIEQVQIPADIWYKFVSSSVIKSQCAGGEYILVKSFVVPPTHNELMKIFLKDEFHQTFGKNQWWERFVKNFEGRSYHNLSHIAYMLNHLNIYIRQGGKVEDEQCLRKAIWYHDLKETEEASAAAMPDFLQKFNDLIMATKHLGEVSSNLSGDARIIHDLDLSILFDDENYLDYAYCLRDEYKQYSNQEYVNARRKILDELIEKIDYQIFPEIATKEARLLMRGEKKELDVFFP